MTQKDYYEVLGVVRDCLPDEIETRYSYLVDLLTSGSLEKELQPWAQGQLIQVEEAYATLGDTARRRAYDLQQGSAQPTTPPPSARSHSAPSAKVKSQTVPRFSMSHPTWLNRGTFTTVLGGFSLGVVVLLLIAAGTGNWDRVTGLFNRTPETSASIVKVDAKRVAELEAAILRDPTDKAALFELGEIYVTAEDWSMVIYWHGRVLEVDPADTHSLNDVALANYYLGRYAEARATWDRALELDPGDPLLHYALAFFLLNSPPYDWGLARTHFQQVTALAPDSSLAQSALSHVQAIDATLTSTVSEGEGGQVQ
ncbi:MAG: tetratricopeptide repeat protein [Chloroflexi bacterium]|nr:tetratricopeptide repeat protein [Chloroflexota bacterium]